MARLLLIRHAHHALVGKALAGRSNVGLDAEGKLGQWQEAWKNPDRLPMQVMMQVQDAEGRDWPELVVALPQGSTAPQVEAEL